MLPLLFAKQNFLSAYLPTSVHKNSHAANCKARERLQEFLQIRTELTSSSSTQGVETLFQVE